MTMLGIPQMPERQDSTEAGPVRFTEGHHFMLAPDVSLDELAEQATVPLSVILQVTKRCNFDCSFCSETLQLPDPTMAELATIRDNLAGTSRVFLSGGEPLLRRDFGDVVDMYGDYILGIPTNATRGLQHAARLVGKVAFVNVGLEGPRSTTNRVRGDYDQVMAGVRALLDHGLPISFSAQGQRPGLGGARIHQAGRGRASVRAAERAAGNP